MKFSRQHNTLIVIFLCIFPFNNSFAASWSVFAWASDPNGEICKFEMPIDLYLSSEHYFSQLRQKCIYGLQITGELKKNDIETLNKIVAFLNSNKKIKRPGEIILDSAGGSIATSLSIANEIRNPASPLYQLSAVVLRNAECHSSCVFILAASFRRYVYGEVGIHRPHFRGNEYLFMGYDTIQEAYRGLYKNLKEFFKNINIHPSLIDDMWFIPSNELKILTNTELEKYGLNKNDMILEEQRLMKLREICGNDAPAFEKHFKFELNQKCADEVGKIESECYLKLLDSYPEWKECQSKLYK